jgi:hypothetical protein
VTTGQPYVFTNDDPLNSSDSLGLAAAALMDGGSLTLQQEAATLNAMFQSAGSAGTVPGEGEMTADIVSNGKYAALIIVTLPKDLVSNYFAHPSNFASSSNSKPTIGVKVNKNGSVTLSVGTAVVIGSVLLAARGLVTCGGLIADGIAGAGVAGTITDISVLGAVLEDIGPLLLI